MNVQKLLIQFFEELGYHKEKQIRLKKLSFLCPPPGTYRFDKQYNLMTDRKKAYLRTKKDQFVFEFICDENHITIYQFGCDPIPLMYLDLHDPSSLDKIKELIVRDETV